MKLLTPSQYAKKHGVHRATVYRWIADRKITFKTEWIEQPMIPANAKPPRVKTDSEQTVALKNKARRAVLNAIINGTLTKDSCEVCGEYEVEAHHASYAKDKWLDVAWLCKKHHAERHNTRESK